MSYDRPMINTKRLALIVKVKKKVIFRIYHNRIVQTSTQIYEVISLSFIYEPNSKWMKELLGIGGVEVDLSFFSSTICPQASAMKVSYNLGINRSIQHMQLTDNKSMCFLDSGLTKPNSKQEIIFPWNNSIQQCKRSLSSFSF